MRRIVLIWLLVLFASAAGWADRPQMVSLEGLVQPAGPSIYMEGSHELHDSKGLLIARLSGKKHNLDLRPVENRWVKLCGEWRSTVEAGGTIFEVYSVELLSHAR